ncbi:MAG: uracil-DNA glycosylase [Desulfuromonadales bacterium]|nr:uracil-DNA glycosylase [Desulfuromonadales bacterium]
MGRIALQGLSDCRKCERLHQFMQQLPPARGRDVADYHNAPVSGFGDLNASVCLVGMAPGAHGANRTGRPFTGDGAGDFMYPLLHEAGFSNQPDAVAADDGLELNDLYITNAVKCLPPQNKPNAGEFTACRDYLVTELAALKRLRVVVALGGDSFRSLLRLFLAQGVIGRMSDCRFSHGGVHRLSNGLLLVGCYHTSRYNVNTGRMTEQLFRAFLMQVKALSSGVVKDFSCGENG